MRQQAGSVEAPSTESPQSYILQVLTPNHQLFELAGPENK